MTPAAEPQAEAPATEAPAPQPAPEPAAPDLSVGKFTVPSYLRSK